MGPPLNDRQPMMELEEKSLPPDFVLPSDLIHVILFYCCPQPVLKSAKVVALLSLISLFFNLIAIMASDMPSTLSTIFDWGLLLVELMCILALAYGLSEKSASYLKPCWRIQLVWNISLFALWIFCLIELLHQRETFALRVLWSASGTVGFDTINRRSVGIWLSIVLLAGLACVICTGLFFLHIVLLAFFFLQRREQFACSAAERLEAKQALLGGMDNI